MKIKLSDIIKAVNNPEPTPQPEPTPAPKAAATDRREANKIPVGERIQLECLLDELLGITWWREVSEEDMLRLASIKALEWELEPDSDARIIAGVIWELTGNVKRIESLGYVMPWWYKRKAGDEDGEMRRISG